MVDDAALVHPHDLLEAERLREEVDRRGAVLVEQVGRDPSHAATLPRCG